jgi:hypothetical protein
MKIASRIFTFISAFFFILALFTHFIFSDWDIPSLFFLISSLILLVIAIVFDRQSFWRILTSKATRQGMTLGGFLSLIVVLLVVVNYGASFLSYKIDFTKEKLHTLSDFSKNVVKSFHEPVEFLYLQIPDENSKGADESIRLAFQKYLDENNLFKMTKLNIMKNPELAKKYKLNDQEQAMFVVFKDRSERFYKTDENSITQALLRLLKGRKTLYFSVGHQELSLKNQSPRGISSLKKEVERLFYDTQEINIEKEIIPADASALVVMAPEKNTSEAFKKKIYEYFKSGGRLFLAFDPVQNPDEEQLLADFGLKMSSGVVHQEQNALANVGSFMVSGWVPEDSKHNLIRSLGRESPVMFYVTGSLSEILPHDYKISPLIVSPKSTVLRAGYTKQDKEIGRGSYVLFTAVENKQGGVVLVSADSDIFANQFLYQQMNPSFMFNVFSFLTKDEEVIKPPQLENVAKDFLVTDTNFKLFMGLFAIPLPLIFMFLSLYWWFRRRWL